MVRYLLCQFDYLIIQKYLIIKAHCYILCVTEKKHKLHNGKPYLGPWWDMTLVFRRHETLCYLQRGCLNKQLIGTCCFQFFS